MKCPSPIQESLIHNLRTHFCIQDQWGDACAVVTFASVAVSFAATYRVAVVAVVIAGAVVAA